jgi:hypothetical protein
LSKDKHPADDYEANQHTEKPDESCDSGLGQAHDQRFAMEFFKSVANHAQNAVYNPTEAADEKAEAERDAPEQRAQTDPLRRIVMAPAVYDFAKNTISFYDHNFPFDAPSPAMAGSRR